MCASTRWGSWSGLVSEPISPGLVHKVVSPVMFRTADSVTPPVVAHHVELCPATGDPLLVEGVSFDEEPDDLTGLVPEIGDGYTGGAGLAECEEVP